MKTYSNLRRDSLLTLLSLLLLHVGTCQAQSSSIIFAIPVSFALVATLICICFWVCFCVQVAKRRQLHGTGATANVHYAPYNQRPYHGSPGAAQPGSYPVQGYVPPSTVTPAGVNPPQTQQAYPGQGYAPPPTAAVSNPSPLAPPGGISEPVSLSEATLYQGDAPPGYAEAIGMKTVDIAGQDKQQA
jgi:hypothetical protein